MLLFLFLALIAFLVNAVFSILPCGVASQTCENPFLPLPEQVGDAFGSFGNTTHFIVYMFGQGIGDAIVNSIALLMAVMLAQLIWNTLLYFRVPIISNIMGFFRANVDKQ